VSSFTTPLIVTPLDDGRTWKLVEPFRYHIGDRNSEDIITIPTGFITDFASVPRIFWVLIPPYGKWGKATVVHDWLYQRRFENKVRCDICGKVFNGEESNKHRIETGHNSWWLILAKTRKEADDVFLEAMGVLGVKNWRKYPMYLAVRAFGFLAWKGD